MRRRRVVSRAAVALGSLVTVALGVVLYASPVRAAGQTVDGTVLLASNGGGVARREWNASAGAVNGVNGYVFAVDPTSVGSYFNLTPTAASTGVGTLSIAFYTDMVNGITCDSVTGVSGGAVGAVCGNYAIVYVDPGANVSFHYVSGLPVPTAPPFVSSNFTFSAPIALAPAAGSTTGNIGEPSVDVDPANRNIYVSAPTGVPCSINS